LIKLSPEKKSRRINKVFLIVTIVTILIFAGSLLFVLQLLGKMDSNLNTGDQRTDSLLIESQKILVDIEKQNTGNTPFTFTLDVISADSCKLEKESFLIINLQDSLQSKFNMITNKNDLCIRVTAGPKIKSETVFGILEVIRHNGIRTEISSE